MRDLHPARPNKRTRNARSRSPSEDTLVPALPAINSDWGLSQDNQGMGRYGRNIRHLQNPPPPSPGLSHQEHQHPHQQYHSMQQQQHPGHGFQYTPLFPVPNQVSPPPAFIPLHQDFGSSRGLAGFGNRPGGSGADGGSGYPDLHQRIRPAESSGYDPAAYPPSANPMTRHAEHHHHQQSLLTQPPPSPPFHAQPPPGAAVPHRREDRAAESLFGSLLEADERSRQRSGSGTVTGGPGAGLDWPMHEGLAPPDRSGPSGAGGPRGSLEGPGNILSFSFTLSSLINLSCFTLSQELQTRLMPLTHGSTISFHDLILLSTKLKIAAVAEALHQHGLGITTMWIRDILKQETIWVLVCMMEKRKVPYVGKLLALARIELVKTLRFYPLSKKE